jgi:DNA-binding transcriptional regulator LsrR (DeoR family)
MCQSEISSNTGYSDQVVTTSMAKARKGIIFRVKVDASAFGAIYRLEGCR